MAYERKDFYYRQAKEKGFKSRSAFKLLDLQKKFRLIKPGMNIIDLGAAPGGWLQVSANLIGNSGKVIGIDLESINGLQGKNIDFIQGSIEEAQTNRLLLTRIGRKVDLVLSDLAPHLSGVKFQDAFHSYLLAQKAFELCRLVLREGGNFVVKIFPGEELDDFRENLKNSFRKVSSYTSEATRKSSIEIYLVAKGFIPLK